MNPDEESATQLCKSCGICCQGLLHTHALLKAHESEKAATLGLEINGEDHPAFALPCPRFAGCCTIYEDRPNACRGFRCALLRRLDDKQISLTDALEIVREAQRLASEAMPGASAADLAREFRVQRRIGQDASVAHNSGADRLKFIALGLHLDKHFVLPRDGNFYSVQTIEAAVDE